MLGRKYAYYPWAIENEDEREEALEECFQIDSNVQLNAEVSEKIMQT
jgi:glutathione S-transferase